MRFRYFPLNHIDPHDGSFLCQGMACDSVRFESCLVHQYCWFENDCSPASQRNVAHFMKCFEGPYANREIIPDPVRRPLCAKESSIDYDLVNLCSANTTEVTTIEKKLNMTRAPMYKKLNPRGLFPHIFVNGAHLYNNSWAALVRILCQEMAPAKVPVVCNSVPLQLTFYLADTGLNKTNVKAHSLLFSKAILEAINLVGSKEWLPINFETQQPDHSPSYVNIQAADYLQITSVEMFGQNTVQINATVQHLKAFQSVLSTGIAGSDFSVFLAWALNFYGYPKITSKNIINQSSVVPGSATIP